MSPFKLEDLAELEMANAHGNNQSSSNKEQVWKGNVML
jgi:hypothetical protein